MVRNILGEQATEYEDLHGRCRFCCDLVGIQSLEHKNVLNVGCGFGWFELYALRHSPTTMTGIEPLAEDLRAAQSSVHDSRTNFQVGNALDLPFEDNHFDTVCCWDVLEHLPRNSEETFFQEVRRVLRPSGDFYLSTPCRSFVSTVTDPAFWLIGHRHYSRAQLRTFAKAADLNVDDLTVRGSFFELLSLWNMYASKWILRRRPVFEHFFGAKEDVEYRSEGFMTVFMKASKPNGNVISAPLRTAEDAPSA